MRRMYMVSCPLKGAIYCYVTGWMSFAAGHIGNEESPVPADAPSVHRPIQSQQQRYTQQPTHQGGVGVFVGELRHGHKCDRDTQRRLHGGFLVGACAHKFIVLFTETIISTPQENPKDLENREISLAQIMGSMQSLHMLLKWWYENLTTWGDSMDVVSKVCYARVFSMLYISTWPHRRVKE